MSGWSEALGVAESSHAFGDLEFTVDILTLGSPGKWKEADPLLKYGFDVSKADVIQDRMRHDDHIRLGNIGFQASSRGRDMEPLSVGQQVADKLGLSSPQAAHKYLVSKNLLQDEYASDWRKWAESDWINQEDSVNVMADQLGKGWLGYKNPVHLSDIWRHEFRHRGVDKLLDEYGKGEDMDDAQFHDLMNQAGLSEEALIRVYDIDHGTEIEETPPGSVLYGGVSTPDRARAWLDHYGQTENIDILREIKGVLDKDAQYHYDALHPEWHKPSWSEKMFNMLGVDD